ncbi:MAG: hypothetical protein ACO38D_10120 [Ilumatobacteraceae bacterium]
MRQRCERIGCGREVAVVYGTVPGRDGSLTLWVDAFRADVSASREREIMGYVCLEHGERLSPPRGWQMDDRRENSPRLFKPQPNLQVVKDKPSRSRREKVGAMPRPSLFAEPTSEVVSESVVAPKVAPAVVAPVVAPEPVPVARPVAVDESYDIPREPDPTGDVTGSWEPFFDPDDDLDGQLNATGSLLRDAFRSRHNGRRNA